MARSASSNGGRKACSRCRQCKVPPPQRFARTGALRRRQRPALHHEPLPQQPDLWPDVPFPERETKDLVCDLATLSLDETLGTSRARALTPADGSIAADVVEIAAGSYLAASRQVQGAHIFGVDGDGYNLVFDDGAGSRRVQDGLAPRRQVSGAGGMRFHQHFNAGAKLARYLGVNSAAAAIRCSAAVARPMVTRRFTRRAVRRFRSPIGPAHRRFVARHIAKEWRAA